MMCLAIPGKVIKICGSTAIIDYGGVRREARIDFVPDVKVGDYVIVHTGFAIEILKEKDALESINAWMEVLGGNDE